MTVLFLKNTEAEGPGTMEDYLRRRGVPLRVLEPGELEGASLEGAEALVVMGGPMGVYEREKHPHLRASLRLIEEAFGKKLRVLGVCLGAQLVAHALGARVYRGHGQELGWMEVELTPEGAGDPAMGAFMRADPHDADVSRRHSETSGAPEGDADDVMGAFADFAMRRVEVFQWHGDTFDLPAGAVRLAGSEAYEDQAFRAGEGVYALQFHIEVTPAMLAQWFGGHPEEGRIREETSRLDFSEYAGRAEGFYRGFFGV
jgi:GMP synthase-like glutamine amidotransferase